MDEVLILGNGAAPTGNGLQIGKMTIMEEGYNAVLLDERLGMAHIHREHRVAMRVMEGLIEEEGHDDELEDRR